MARKILIIDDDPVIVKYLTALFQDNGYETRSATDAQAGLDLLKTEIPDLITLDLQMPDEWGPRFYRRLTKDETLKDIPVIVISGIAGEHAIKKAVAYFSKPFDADKLLLTVKRTIG